MNLQQRDRPQPKPLRDRATQTPPIRVGIIAPCPPPFGGITRVIQNHLAYWDPGLVESHFVPVYPPQQADPFDGALFHRLAESSDRSFRGVFHYLKCLSRAPITKPWVYRHFWQYCAGLSRLIEVQDLNVIYAHGIWPAGAAAVLLSRLHRIGSVVVTYGETWHSTAEHKRWARIEPFVLAGARRLVSTSEHCRAAALRRGSDRQRHSVVYAGIDLERFRPGLDGRSFRKKSGIRQDAFVISSLGLSLRRKLDTLLDALEVIPKSHNIQCLIGGVGRDTEYVQTRAQHMAGVEVQMLGFVPEDELPAFYAATDVLVVSPNTRMECMGQSMKEAMACGRTVVGADIGGIPEAIKDNLNGLLYRAEDPADLRRALVRLSRDSGLCARLGASGRAFAESKFDARDAAEQTLDIIRLAIRDGGEGH